MFRTDLFATSIYHHFLYLEKIYFFEQFFRMGRKQVNKTSYLEVKFMGFYRFGQNCLLVIKSQKGSEGGGVGYLIYNFLKLLPRNNYSLG